MKTIHLANVACGLHASYFSFMNYTVEMAKETEFLVGAHPSLLDRQGFGRREMTISPIKPHGAVYGQCARSAPLANAAASVAEVFLTPNNPNVKSVGLAGTEHETAAMEGAPFIPGICTFFHYSSPR
ncbi:hypothetical protein BDQ17DRAFT_1362204 [Cyathus striatus]|nr:hypothetical protein BDQ17DRAFT_1362204 [Cyathus striatus]